MLRSALAVARRRRASTIAAGAAVSVLLVIGAAGVWAAGTRSPSGHFSSTVVTGAACQSPIELCTEGSLTGGLKGSFSFTGTSLIQTVDTPTTAVVLYTGDLSVNTKDGEFTCKDAGAFRTTGDGATSSVCTIVSGTGAYAGATGTIQFSGTFSSASGGNGDYSGTLVFP
jgi:hypothetical protein